MDYIEIFQLKPTKVSNISKASILRTFGTELGAFCLDGNSRNPMSRSSGELND
jgi:hypothetical protein